MNTLLLADNWLHATAGFRWLPRVLGMCWLIDRHLDAEEAAG